jgi:TolB-like protein
MGTALVANNSSDDKNGEGLNKRIAKPNYSTKKGNRAPKLIAAFLLILLFFALLYFFYQTYSDRGDNSIDELEKSIAVLAFKNMSNDPEQEYFSDGISEEIINAISNIEGLKVAGRTSSFSFKGKNEDLREIADKLGVAMILEGSVRKSGDQLRITAQLINAETGFNMWSNTFDGNITDIFKVQDEIAKSVIDKLRISLQSPGKGGSYTYQPNKDAYDLYLRGTYHWNKRGTDLFKALDYYSQAIAVDSGYAKAHAGLAQTYVLIGWYEMKPASELYPLAKISTDVALSLDPNSVEALAALAFYYQYYKWDIVKSERAFKQALKANYSYAPAHYWYNNVLRATGRLEEAIREAKIAIELEPLAVLAHVTLASAYLGAKEYEQALEVSLTGHELNPFILTFTGIADALSGLKRYDEAEEILLSGIERLDRNPFLLSPLCELYAKTGRIEKATVILEELISRQKTEHISFLVLARAAWAIGREDEAIEYYREALTYKSSQLINQLGPYADISPKLKFIDEALNLFP